MITPTLLQTKCSSIGQQTKISKLLDIEHASNDVRYPNLQLQAQSNAAVENRSALVLPFSVWVQQNPGDKNSKYILLAG